MSKARITAWPSGKEIDLLEPTLDMLDIRDMAHSLAGINRFTAHTREYYNVAEHSIIGSHFIEPQFALEFLMHDASHEPYLGDVSSPLKKLIAPLYMPLVANFDRLAAIKWGLRTDEKAVAAVKAMDAMMLDCEMHVLKDMPLTPWAADVQMMTKICGRIRAVDKGAVAKEFLARFHFLIAQRHPDRVAAAQAESQWCGGLKS